MNENLRKLYTDVYPEIGFGGFTRCDATVEFYSRVQALLLKDSQVLDIGCGRGRAVEDLCCYRKQLRDLRGPDRHVIGIDVDQAAEQNSSLDEFRKIDDVLNWPIEDGQVDLAVANAVIEHIANPAEFFSEAHRVLKLGGYLCARTFNVWNYVGILSRAIPNRFHAAVTSKVQKNRKEEDVFDTHYRCNTRRRLTRALKAAGFEPCVYTLESEPNYLRFSRVAFRVAASIHAFMPPPLRWTLLAFARKT